MILGTKDWTLIQRTLPISLRRPLREKICLHRIQQADRLWPLLNLSTMKNQPGKTPQRKLPPSHRLGMRALGGGVENYRIGSGEMVKMKKEKVNGQKMTIQTKKLVASRAASPRRSRKVEVKAKTKRRVRRALRDRKDLKVEAQKTRRTLIRKLALLVHPTRL